MEKRGAHFTPLVEKYCVFIIKTAYNKKRQTEMLDDIEWTIIINHMTYHCCQISRFFESCSQFNFQDHKYLLFPPCFLAVDNGSFKQNLWDYWKWSEWFYVTKLQFSEYEKCNSRKKTNEVHHDVRKNTNKKEIDKKVGKNV